MGSTRFLKVARAKTDEGLVVVKVFVKHDPSLPLEQHVDKIEYIKKNLANAVNCLPFQRVLVSLGCDFSVSLSFLIIDSIVDNRTGLSHHP